MRLKNIVRQCFLHFRNVLLIYAIIAIKHDLIIHLHSQGPSGRLKTSGFALGFQHFPRDLANVNEWKIMFDPSNVHILN